MAEYIIQDTTLNSIADKIRILYGTEDTMTPAVMNNQLINANIEVNEQTNLIKRILEALGLNVALITFYLDSEIEYQAEEGMTWAEWCESEYNTDNWFVQGDGIYANSARLVYESSLQYVDSTEIISANVSYTFM